MGVLDDVSETLDFPCPRCHRGVSQQFYGPCETCLGELRVKYQSERSDLVVADYEPKMNVTPNAVALKDD